MEYDENAAIWDKALATLARRPDISSRQLGVLRLAVPISHPKDLDTFRIAVPHEQARAYLERSIREVVASVLAEEIGREMQLVVAVDAGVGADQSAEAVGSIESSFDDNVAVSTATARAPRDRAARFNPLYQFETFVVGASNKFAHASAVAVAEAPAQAYNPLFIYGGPGLGKTHLLHSIGHYAQFLDRDASVNYVNSEEFTNDFINAIYGPDRGGLIPFNDAIAISTYC